MSRRPKPSLNQAERKHPSSLDYGTTVKGVPKYIVRFRDHEGKSRQRNFPTQKGQLGFQKLLSELGLDEALKVLEGAANESSAVGDLLYTVEQMCRDYITFKSSGLESGTSEHYEMYLRTGIGPFMGETPAHMVTPQKVSDYVQAETAAGRGAKTVKNRYGFLASSFKHAVDAGRVASTPCRGILLPQGEREGITFLSPAEFQKLISYIPEPERDIAVFLAATGMRFNEMTALRPKDFNFTLKEVNVKRAWKRSKKKGWYIGAPKTKKGVRAVPLSDELIPLAKRHIANGHKYVFTNRQGNPMRQQRFYNGYWAPARNLANGLPPFEFKESDNRRPTRWKARRGMWWDIPPAEEPIGQFPRVHDLRHSHASWLIEQGVELTVIQYRLGHESIKTTVDVYGHLAESFSRKAAKQTSLAMKSVFANMGLHSDDDAERSTDSMLMEEAALLAQLEAVRQKLSSSQEPVLTT